MIERSTAGIIAELFLYAILIVILVRIFIYVRKQSRQVDELRKKIEMIDKTREK
jgi:hypothetical protein